MTRINVVEPQELHTRHLIAEYKEFTQFIHFVRKREHFNDLPKAYTMDTGHCKFFYDKGAYMIKRFNKIVEEMLERNLKVDLVRFNERADLLEMAYWRPETMKDYEPTEEALRINRERISLRKAEKPELYV